jgi:hypothetical protein
LIDFLQSNEIGAGSLDHLRDPREVQFPIDPFGMMNVVAKNP